jgi:hypothetical protein
MAFGVPLPMIAHMVDWSAGTLAKMSLRYGYFSVEEMRSAMQRAGKNSPGVPTKVPTVFSEEKAKLQ